MASFNFTTFAKHLAQANVDFNNADLKTLLVSSVPTSLNRDNWEFLSDVTNEVTGTGYAAGGVIQPYTLDALDTANNRQPITLTDLLPGWTTATITAVGAITYKDTGSAGTSILIGFEDFGGTVSSTAGDFSITFTAPIYITCV